METPLKKSRRRYSEREKAAALALFDACGNLSEASRATGIPTSTIFGWLSEKPSIEASDIALLRKGYERSTESLADRFESIALAATGEISSRLGDAEKVKDIPLHHLLRSAEVGAEKSQLLRGLPTNITEERIEGRAVLILMSNALGIPVPAIETEGRTIDGA